MRCDKDVAWELLRKAANASVPIVGANYDISESASSDMPTTWGTLVPLWFPLKEKSVKSKVVIVTPSREIPGDSLDLELRVR